MVNDIIQMLGRITFNSLYEIPGEKVEEVEDELQPFNSLYEILNSEH